MLLPFVHRLYTVLLLLPFPLHKNSQGSMMQLARNQEVLLNACPFVEYL